MLRFDFRPALALAALAAALLACGTATTVSPPAGSVAKTDSAVADVGAVDASLDLAAPSDAAIDGQTVENTTSDEQITPVDADASSDVETTEDTAEAIAADGEASAETGEVAVIDAQAGPDAQQDTAQGSELAPDADEVLGDVQDAAVELDQSTPDASDAAAPDSEPADSGVDAAPDLPPGCQKNSDCVAQEDGDLCNGTLYCNPTTKLCAVNPSTVVKCPTDLDTTCAKAACVPATGQCVSKPVKNGTVCNDGQKCTEGDVCIDGLCEAGEEICICKQNADCAAKEDGNVCNGTLFCNKATGKCQLNPATIVSCPSVDDTACTKNLCQAKTGQCAMTPVADALPCDDGNPCTPNEGCKGGKCTATANTCECSKDADCIAKDDGNLCNGLLYCNLKQLPHVCELNPASVVSCPSVDDTSCTQHACAPKTGKCVAVVLPDGATCDADGSECTQGDHCKSGICTASQSVCMCQSDADCGKYEDGDLCNGTLYCNPVLKACIVNPATIVQCPFGQDNTCLQNQCDAATGKCAMTPVNGGGSCDADGNPCTPYDSCLGGKCQQGANVCQCQQLADCAPKDDSNPCNGTLACDTKNNVCVVNLATVVTCADDGGLPCTRNLCNPANGKCQPTAVYEGKWCNGDDNPCTLNDTCVAGACSVGKNICACDLDPHCDGKDDASKCNGTLYCNKAQAPYVCEVASATVVKCSAANDSACLKNQCVSLSGKCVPTPVAAGVTCDDGNLCTPMDHCKLGLCSGLPLDCDDGDPCTADACLAKNGVCSHKLASCDDANSCTADTCDATKGCLNLPVAGTAACDDGDLCSQPDVCGAGMCAGSKLTCDDGKPCTTDSCNALTGCVNASVADGQPCSDGNLCTQSDTCKQSGCGGKPVDCDDGEPCTVDACAAKTGNCTHTGLDKACDDSNPCTIADSCKTGACKGAPKSCDDGKPCTLDGCDAKAGCKVIGSTQAGTGCDDSDACTQSDACDGSGACKGQPKTCFDNNLCTDDGCDAKIGCTFAAKSGQCDDGNACTNGDGCTTDGGCKGVATSCDDGNPCTDDSCDPNNGCIAANNSKPCTHANQCLTGTACSNGQCQGGSAIVCDDKVACTVDSCDAVKGCQFKASDALCDDGDPCTDQKCDLTKGCANPSLPDATPCATDRFCSAGLCVWATQLDVGTQFACAVRADRTVWCWGHGEHGQMGNDTSGTAGGYPVINKVPGLVQGLTGAAQVSAGNKSACATTTGGQVYCWGLNTDYDTLGLGTAVGVIAIAKPMKGIANAVEAAAGWSNACARLANGELWCSGFNTYGLFGTGSTKPLYVSPAVPTGFGKPSAVAIGGWHLCALVDGVVKCAGWNTFGQMATGQTTPDHYATPQTIPVGPAIAVASGEKHSCALLQDGTARCWGSCSFGQHGTGKPCPDKGVVMQPENVAGLDNLRHLDAAYRSTCAVRKDGSVWCWGNNDNAQLGDGGTGTQLSPRQVVDLPPCVSVAVGDDFSCARDAVGQIHCWGNGRFGGLDDGGWDYDYARGWATVVPTSKVVGGTLCKTIDCDDGNPCTQDGCDANGACTHKADQDGSPCTGGNACHQGVCKWASDVAAGLEHSCALRPDGQVMCWGRNLNGQIGAGAFGGILASPNLVVGAKDAVQIAAGGATTCIVQKAGTVQCWGGGDKCQLGGQPGDQAKAITVAGLSNVSVVAVGKTHVCAMDKATTEVRCWGSNSLGEVGNGAASSTPVCQPTLALAVKPTTAKVGRMALGGQFSLASNDSGFAYFWGNNDLKQLTGQYAQNHLPQPAAQAISPWKWVTAGHAFACATGPDGQPRCWGDNAKGQVTGSPSAVVEGFPVVVGGAGLLNPLAAGGQHACGVSELGTVKCWGAAASGQLGQGEANASGVVTVADLFDTVRLAAGGDHTCAVDKVGQVRCWGAGSFGELGTGQSGPGVQSAVPILVAPSAATSKGALCSLFEACADGDDCTQDLCNVKSGACSHPAVEDGTPCMGGNGKVCAAGQCKTPFATDVAVGWGFSCVIRTDASVWCAGSNSSGQLGGSLTLGNDYNTFKPVTGLGDKAVSIAANDSQACAVRADGKVYCWGSNMSGALGAAVPIGSSQNKPVEVVGVAAKTGVAVGIDHACAWGPSNGAHCWGRNDKGQLGSGQVQALAPTYQANAVAVVGLGDIVSMVAAETHTCARTKTNALYCWGMDNGLLGNKPTNNPLATPQLVATSGPTAAMASHLHTTFALTTAGAVHGWTGNAGYGLPGYYFPLTYNTAAAAPQVPVIDKVALLSGGFTNVCAVQTKGIVSCWGSNNYGESQPAFGFPQTLRPATVHSVHSVARLACGREHCCAVRTDGSLGCWGLNWYGEFGDGTVNKSKGQVVPIPGTEPL